LVLLGFAVGNFCRPDRDFQFRLIRGTETRHNTAENSSYLSPHSPDEASFCFDFGAIQL
jgi:hypothetical protein